LQQVDGKALRLEDKADFKIMEFNKENRRIVASHARTWQEAKDKERSGEEQEVAKYQAKSKQDSSNDSGIMGELSALSDLREQILAGEQKAAQDAMDKLDKPSEAASGPESQAEADTAASDSETNA